MKSCTYCGNSFQEKRSDAKYCGTRCKNKASIDRKVLRESNSVQLGLNNNDLSQSNVINELVQKLVQSNPQKIKPATIDTLSGLLAEKDFSRDLTSQLTEYRMKVLYLEDRVKDKENQIETLIRRCESHEKEIARYEKKKKYNDEGFWSTFGHTCSTDPAAAEKMIGAMERTAFGFATMVGSIKKGITPKTSNSPNLGNVSSNILNQSTASAPSETKPNPEAAKNVDDGLEYEEESSFTEEQIKINQDSTIKVTNIISELESMAGDDPVKFNEIVTKLETNLSNPMIQNMILNNTEQNE